MCNSAGLSCDRARAGHTTFAHFESADPNSIDGSDHRSFGQLSSLRQAFSKADCSRKRVENAKTGCLRLCDQQPAIIRTKVERSINVPGPFYRPCTVFVFRFTRRASRWTIMLHPTRKLRHGAYLTCFAWCAPTLLLRRQPHTSTDFSSRLS